MKKMITAVLMVVLVSGSALAENSAVSNGSINSDIYVEVQGSSPDSNLWNYSPSSSSINQTHDGDIYGSLPYAGRPYGPVHGSNHLLTPRKNRKNLRPGLEIINFGMPGEFTAQNFSAFKAGIIKSRGGQEFWDKLVGEYTTGSLTLFVDPASLPEITVTKSVTKSDLRGLVPGIDYIRYGEYQLDAETEKVLRQFILPIIVNEARKNRISVVVLEDDVVFRAGTKKMTEGKGWSIGLGFSLKLNGAPSVSGLGYGSATSEESLTEEIYAGSSMAFIAPKSKRFWMVVNTNRAKRFGVEIEKVEKSRLIVAASKKKK